MEWAIGADDAGRTDEAGTAAARRRGDLKYNNELAGVARDRVAYGICTADSVGGVGGVGGRAS